MALDTETRDQPIEMMCRFVRGTQEGTSRIRQPVIARDLLKGD